MDHHSYNQSASANNSKSFRNYFFNYTNDSKVAVAIEDKSSTTNHHHHHHHIIVTTTTATTNSNNHPPHGTSTTSTSNDIIDIRRNSSSNSYYNNSIPIYSTNTNISGGNSSKSDGSSHTNYMNTAVIKPDMNILEGSCHDARQSSFTTDEIPVNNNNGNSGNNNGNNSGNNGNNSYVLSNSIPINGINKTTTTGTTNTTNTKFQLEDHEFDM